MPRTPLFHPEEYFRSYDVRLGRTLVVVFLAGIVLAAGLYAVIELLVSRVTSPPPALRNAAYSVLFDSTLALIIGLFVGILIEAVIVYVIAAWVLDGRGNLGQTVAVIGWGVVPDTAAALIAFGRIAVALRGREIPAEPEPFRAAVMEAFGSAMSGSIVFAILAAAWSVYIWGPGLESYHDFRPEQAYAVAVVVAVIGLVLSQV